MSCARDSISFPRSISCSKAVSQVFISVNSQHCSMGWENLEQIVMHDIQHVGTICCHRTPRGATKLHTQLEGCIVLNKHNTAFARSSPLYVTGFSLGPSESWTQTVSRSLPSFLQGSLQKDRPTDHASRSFTICLRSRSLVEKSGENNLFWA